MFVGNLSYNLRDSDISEIFKKDKLYPTRVRMLNDQEGKFKGCAFVEFETKGEAD